MMRMKSVYALLFVGFGLMAMQPSEVRKKIAVQESSLPTILEKSGLVEQIKSYLPEEKDYEQKTTDLTALKMTSWACLEAIENSRDRVLIINANGDEKNTLNQNVEQGFVASIKKIIDEMLFKQKRGKVFVEAVKKIVNERTQYSKDKRYGSIKKLIIQATGDRVTMLNVLNGVIAADDALWLECQELSLIGDLSLNLVNEYLYRCKNITKLNVELSDKIQVAQSDENVFVHRLAELPLQELRIEIDRSCAEVLKNCLEKNSTVCFSKLQKLVLDINHSLKDPLGLLLVSRSLQLKEFEDIGFLNVLDFFISLDRAYSGLPLPSIELVNNKHLSISNENKDECLRLWQLIKNYKYIEFDCVREWPSHCTFAHCEWLKLSHKGFDSHYTPIGTDALRSVRSARKIEANWDYFKIACCHGKDIIFDQCVELNVDCGSIHHTCVYFLIFTHVPKLKKFCFEGCGRLYRYSDIKNACEYTSHVVDDLVLGRLSDLKECIFNNSPINQQIIRSLLNAYPSIISLSWMKFDDFPSFNGSADMEAFLKGLSHEKYALSQWGYNGPLYMTVKQEQQFRKKFPYLNFTKIKIIHSNKENNEDDF